MPGSSGFSIPDWFGERYEVPVLVDNDVNIMATGEHWARWRDTDHLLFVKVGTGIGCGIVADGPIHRGVQGAAGDIGHIAVPGREDAVPLRQHRLPRGDRRWRRAGPAAERGRALGEVLAGCVNFFNPSVIVIGGDIGQAHEQLLAGVREVTFQRSLPLATRDLMTVPSALDDRAGIVGAAIMVTERVLAPDAIDRAIQGGIAA